MKKFVIAKQLVTNALIYWSIDLCRKPFFLIYRKRALPVRANTVVWNVVRVIHHILLLGCLVSVLNYRLHITGMKLWMNSFCIQILTDKLFFSSKSSRASKTLHVCIEFRRNCHKVTNYLQPWIAFFKHLLLRTEKLGVGRKISKNSVDSRLLTWPHKLFARCLFCNRFFSAI